MISYIEFYLIKVKCFKIRLPITPKPIPTANETIKSFKMWAINKKKSFTFYVSSFNNISSEWTTLKITRDVASLKIPSPKTNEWSSGTAWWSIIKVAAKESFDDKEDAIQLISYKLNLIECISDSGST